MSYLASLTLRLAAGVGRLPEAIRRRHAAFLAAAQQDDGGFAGRQGPSDLYYTGFALRGLGLLGQLGDPIAGRAASFLQRQLDRAVEGIDFYSLLSGAALLEMNAGLDIFSAAGRCRGSMVAEHLARLRRPDGGYAKTAQSPHSSTYHTFLALLCCQLAGLPIDEPDRTTRMILTRRREDGGFAELGPLRHGGTNPTAAAVAVLKMLDALDTPTRTGAATFLAGLQAAEGGLRANGRIPLADLLSTFTGLVALVDLDALDAIDLPAVGRYVYALQEPGGGFRAAGWDDTPDVEYTFYGLGSLALVAEE